MVSEASAGLPLSVMQSRISELLPQVRKVLWPNAHSRPPLSMMASWSTKVEASFSLNGTLSLRDATLGLIDHPLHQVQQATLLLQHGFRSLCPVVLHTLSGRQSAGEGQPAGLHKVFDTTCASAHQGRHIADRVARQA